MRIAESNFFFGGNASLIFLTFGLHFEKGCNKGEEENKWGDKSYCFLCWTIRIILVTPSSKKSIFYYAQPSVTHIIQNGGLVALMALTPCPQKKKKKKQKGVEPLISWNLPWLVVVGEEGVEAWMQDSWGYLCTVVVVSASSQQVFWKISHLSSFPLRGTIIFTKKIQNFWEPHLLQPLSLVSLFAKLITQTSQICCYNITIMSMEQKSMYIIPSILEWLVAMLSPISRNSVHFVPFWCYPIIAC